MANPLQQALQRDRQLAKEALKKEGGEERVLSALDQLKEVLNHVTLYAGLVLYTTIGALVRVNLDPSQLQ